MQNPHVPGTRVRIEYAEATDPGRDPAKQVNEDSCGYRETRFGHLVVLCDGMGGHYGGREASRTAIATIFEWIEQVPPGTTPSAAMKAALEEAGRRVFHLGGPVENRGRPGSTVVALLFGDRGLDVAHVGDSRAYCIRAGQIYPLTRDHSVVQSMIDSGMISEAEAIGHPEANKITRALGMAPEVDVEVRPEPMELFAGDMFLQSSDGLTDLVLAPDILRSVRQTMSKGTFVQASRQLVELANDRGGHDNITVQMVRIIDAPMRASQTIPEGPAMAAPPVAPRPVPLHETVPMNVASPLPQTKVGMPPPPIATTLVSANQPANPVTAPAAWAPVGPTAVDRPAAPFATVSDAHAMRPAPMAAQLPLPPPSSGHAPIHPTQVQTPEPPTTQPQPQVHQSLIPVSGRHAGRPSQAGIMYVVIAMSAVIAVLLLLLIWAVVLR
ncbi:MAG TPA: protein phosphatase 2C domain-containing protein [Polyangium sp.]|nr:protein phosphatase 2C domain-containing protein [Polyangium sp.]